MQSSFSYTHALHFSQESVHCDETRIRLEVVGRALESLPSKLVSRRNSTLMQAVFTAYLHDAHPRKILFPNHIFDHTISMVSMVHASEQS